MNNSSSNKSHHSGGISPRINKEIVGQRFDRRAHEYDRYADVQIEMIRTLLDWRPVQQHMQLLADLHSDQNSRNREPIKLLDIGCGTGALTQAAVSTSAMPSSAQLSLLDISSRMLQEAQRKLMLTGYDVEQLQLIEADAEKWAVVDVDTDSDTGNDIPSQDSYDLILSSAAFQWFNQPQSTLQAIYRRLRPRGMIAFATFMPGTLQQLHDACAYADSQFNFEVVPRGQAYVNGVDWQVWIGEYASSSAWMEQEWTLSYNSIEEMLQRVRRIGASNALQQHSTPITRKWLHYMKEYYYEHHGTEDGGVHLTYRAGFGYISNEQISN
ncbi:methyltransferase domain-containing protein [Paenibacillus sp. SC116]|uniref:methyltransferase n=1 Tax=Paenibacillus sp. SC116 TaxID=2968986 RepID=UPI00215A31B4|nr:methyltransferase [Paenibacillus sp. SC116]MCR8846517.1 methyltransferase domain-containing protein [Paenibacillus sp. SC116]